MAASSSARPNAAAAAFGGDVQLWPPGAGRDVVLELRRLDVRPPIVGGDGRRVHAPRRLDIEGAHVSRRSFQCRPVAENDEREANGPEARRSGGEEAHERVVIGINPLERHSVSRQELPQVGGAGGGGGPTR